MKDILEDLDLNLDPHNDQEIKDKESVLAYFQLITENIRINNRVITRNSFVLVLCVAFYFLLLSNSINELSLFTARINDKNLLFNIISVVFAYLYLQNIARWYNNNDQIRIFEALSIKLFKLGFASGTTNQIRPFSMLFHSLDFQTENKTLHWLFRAPPMGAQIIILLFPIIFEIYSIYSIFSQEEKAIWSWISVAIVLLLMLITIIYSAKPGVRRAQK